MLAHIEDGYKDDIAKAGTTEGSAQQPGDRLFQRIKAARATKSKGALEAFLTELECDIRRHCSVMRREHAAELEASREPTPDKASPNATQSSSSSSPLLSCAETEESDVASSFPDGLILSSDSGSTAENPITSDVPSSLEDQSGTSTTETRTRTPSPFVETSDTEDVELHKYSEVLQSYADSTKTVLQVIPGPSRTMQGWPCKVVFGDIERSAVAKNKKTAGHIAARSICQHLSIAE